MSGPPEKNWWSRNWKWVVPVGCLSPVLCCGGGTTLLVALIFGAMKSSDVYTDAVSLAKASDRVKALFGEPIEPGFMVSGNLEVSGPAGSADLAVPISEPKRSAILYVVAKKSAGRWNYSTLEVAPPDPGARIDLRLQPEP